MTRSGRFLWLDWAQAQVIGHEKAQDGAWERLAARHDGYRRLGLIHQRVVTAFREGRWQVEDSVLKAGSLQVEGPKYSNPTLNIADLSLHSKIEKPVICNLQWLMPDWDWEIVENGDSRMEIRLRSPWGWVAVEIRPGDGAKLAAIQLIRAGQRLFGSGEAVPFHGWVSPTYGQKLPALSLTVTAAGTPPITLTTNWLLPSDLDDQKPSTLNL
jgi:hypothetical protein